MAVCPPLSRLPHGEEGGEEGGGEEMLLVSISLLPNIVTIFCRSVLVQCIVHCATNIYLI